MKTLLNSINTGILALVGAVTLGATTISAQTGANLAIVFGSDRTGNQEIWRMKADGSDIRRLTTNTVNAFRPFPSTDGKRIAYMRDAAGGREVRIMNPDGSNDSLIRSFPDGASTDLYLTGWLSDDSKLLFSQWGDTCFSKIWSLPLDGSDPTVFLDPSSIGKQEAYTLDFSSDGKRAIWTSQDGCWSPTFEIFSANYTNGAIDFASVRQMTTNSTGEMYPHFSPDGSLFVDSRSARPPGYGYPVNVFVTGSTGETNLTPLMHSATPTDWTPGDKVLVQARETSETVGQHLYIMTAAGVMTQLTSGTSTDGDARWLRAPDYSLAIQMCAALTLNGSVGKQYRIDYADYLTPTNWQVLTNLTLATNSCLFIDLDSLGKSHRFYRAVPGPISIP